MAIEQIKKERLPGIVGAALIGLSVANAGCGSVYVDEDQKTRRSGSHDQDGCTTADVALAEGQMDKDSKPGTQGENFIGITISADCGRAVMQVLGAHGEEANGGNVKDGIDTFRLANSKGEVISDLENANSSGDVWFNHLNIPVAKKGSPEAKKPIYMEGNIGNYIPKPQEYSFIIDGKTITIIDGDTGKKLNIDGNFPFTGTKTHVPSTEGGN